MNDIAFWIDAEYDRDNASDGVSRFGAYVRLSSLIAECYGQDDDDEQARRAWFAVAAWETANPPVMAPGYVRRHPRVRRAWLQRRWDKPPLAGFAELVVPWPAALVRSREWQAGAQWRNWPVESFAVEDHYHEPDDEEITQRPYLLTTARLMFPLSGVPLPDAPAGPAEAGESAHEVVAALVDAMNAVVTPVIAALERS
jgi:hypothetical protein